MDEISGIVLELEKSEQAAMQSQIEKAEGQGDQTGIIIAVFCIISCLLLILAGYAIYVYIRKNDAYKKALRGAKNEIQAKNMEVIASINYARRIQTAILPDDKKINHLFPQSCVIYEPKDIVAGDFYWMTEIGNDIFIAVADCTGHGVPGAMVSMPCSAALNRCVKEFGLRKPSEILDKCREIIIETFDEGDFEVYDGMDIALCRVNRTKKELQFAGANNPLYRINKGNLEEIKADRQPVARYANIKPFTNHVISVEKEDVFYLFTDGFADQFGGPKGKKFMYRRFKETLVQGSADSLETQCKTLLKVLKDWQGNFEQIDDVCVIGFKV